VLQNLLKFLSHFMINDFTASQTKTLNRELSRLSSELEARVAENDFNLEVFHFAK